MPDYTVEYALNRAQPAEVADLLREIDAGTTLRGLMKPIAETILSADIVAGAGTLAFKPAYVESFTLNTATHQSLVIIPTGMIPQNNEVSIDHDTGNFLFNYAGVFVSAVIVYAPMPTKADNIDASWPS